MHSSIPLTEGTFGGMSATVMQRCGKGPLTVHEEFVRLYEGYRGDVFRYLLSIGIGSETAQDITQEVFLRLYIVLRSGTTVINERAWLFTAAYRMAIDSYRESSLNASLTTRDLPVPPYTGPEERVLEMERSDRLRQALRELSPQQINCLNLRAEGFRYREIAEITGITTSAVGEFLRRAIIRLRRALYG